MKRIYVCHTYYHVYVSILKELNFQQEQREKGTLVLSLVSTNFNNLKERLLKAGMFYDVLELNEVNPRFFKTPFKYEIGKGNWIWKLFTRILYWRYIGKNEAPYIDIDFKNYDDIFVYCDNDPIGQYLNYKKINYHAVEDGLDSLKFGMTESINKQFFGLKLFLAKLGILFINDGYSKYAIDVEVNNKNLVAKKGRVVNEVSRKQLLDNLTTKEKELIYDTFFIGVTDKQFNNDKKNIMILTQGVCTTDMRIKMYKDIIRDYCKGYNVYIKPHPIDNVDYKKKFPECIVLEQFFPIEILNFKCELNIEMAIAVYSASIEELIFANKKMNIGVSFLDHYEDRSLHEHLLSK